MQAHLVCSCTHVSMCCVCHVCSCRCYDFQVPDVDQGRQIIGTVGIENAPIAGYVHHMLLYACESMPPSLPSGRMYECRAMPGEGNCLTIAAVSPRMQSIQRRSCTCKATSMVTSFLARDILSLASHVSVCKAWLQCLQAV